MKKVFPVIYLAILAVNLYGEHAADNLLIYISKPLLLTSIMILAVSTLIRKGVSNFGYFMLSGMFFSLCGDLFMMFKDQDNSYFLLGLSSFLFAHMLYIAAFTQTYMVNHEIPFLKRFGWAMVLVIGYGIYFFNGLKEHLHDLFVPVLVYTVAIVLMVLMALNRFRKVSDKSFWLVTIGSLLFVTSDSVLAWNKFIEPVENSGVIIMLTYGLAQLGIGMGAVEQMSDQPAHSRV